MGYRLFSLLQDRKVGCGSKSYGHKKFLHVLSLRRGGEAARRWRQNFDEARRRWKHGRTKPNIEGSLYVRLRRVRWTHAYILGQEQDALQTAEKLATARALYLQEIKAQKRAHWREFLNDPANVWKANSFTRTESSTGKIPTLVMFILVRCLLRFSVPFRVWLAVA